MIFYKIKMILQNRLGRQDEQNKAKVVNWVSTEPIRASIADPNDSMFSNTKNPGSKFIRNKICETEAIKRKYARSKISNQSKRFLESLEMNPYYRLTQRSSSAGSKKFQEKISKNQNLIEVIGNAADRLKNIQAMICDKVVARQSYLKAMTSTNNDTNQETNL